MPEKPKRASTKKSRPRIGPGYFASLFEMVPEALVIVDNDGLILQINSEFSRIFGYTAREAIGAILDDLVAPPDLASEAHQISRAAESGERFALETLRRRKSGEIFHASVIGAPIVSGGRQVGCFGIYRDISAQKIAEKALTESEKRYRGFFENVPVGIFQTTPDGRYLDANAAHLQIFGFPDLQTLRGMNAADFYSNPEEREKWKERMNRDNVMLAQDFHFRRSDGRMIWTRESARTVRDEQGDVLYYEGIVEDITALKEAEQAFLREKAFLEQLVESAPEAIVLSDNDGRILRVNSEFEKVFGYTAEETIGRQIDDLVAPADLRDEAEKITTAVSQGRRFALETVRRHKNGDLFHVSLVGSPIVIDGEQVAVYGIYRDISDRKKAESSLQERTRQLEEANALLEQISNLDGLTAIPNRRYFEHFYDIEWRRARREKKEISMIMIDVDFFKDYNDRYGHLAGDECLKKIAKTLQVANRAGDVVARYGGEEFVVVLPSTGPAGARHLAQLMRRRVKDLNIEHGLSPLSRCVTISLGIATVIPDHNSDPLSLRTKADQALYRAKINGRDRIEGPDDHKEST